MPVKHYHMWIGTEGQYWEQTYDDLQKCYLE
jgi:hypothetical protein